jgi:hypothetical protein
MGFSYFILELKENIKAILFKLTVYHLKKIYDLNVNTYSKKNNMTKMMSGKN